MAVSSFLMKYRNKGSRAFSISLFRSKDWAGVLAGLRDSMRGLEEKAFIRSTTSTRSGSGRSSICANDPKEKETNPNNTTNVFMIEFTTAKQKFLSCCEGKALIFRYKKTRCRGLNLRYKSKPYRSTMIGNPPTTTSSSSCVKSRMIKFPALVNENTRPTPCGRILVKSDNFLKRVLCQGS